MAEPIDMAIAAAEKLQLEHMKGVEEGTIKLTEDEDIMKLESTGKKNADGKGSKLRPRSSIMDTVRFGYRPKDKMMIEQLKAGADAAFLELFDDALVVLDDFYLSVREPRMSGGSVVKDNRGRIVWQVDDHGNPIQNWDKLTGQDFETALFRLQEVKMYLARPLNELLLGAMFSKHVHDDAWSDAYSSVVEGTIGDREARANREARTDKYAAFFRFWLWSSGDAFMKEINSFQRLLERTRDAHVWSQRN